MKNCLRSTCLILLFILLFAFASCDAISPAKVNGEVNGGLLTVSFLDVGQGDSTLIYTADAAILIDGGSYETGNRVTDALSKLHISRLDAVIVTHPHADHIGGNRYLQEQTNCRIFAPGIDCDFTNHPILEPAFLYGGDPLRDLKHKFLLAQESRAEKLTQDVLPDGMELIPLPGHCFDMVGFRTSDNVVYLADCLSSRETLDKYGVGYLWDVEAYLA